MYTVLIQKITLTDEMQITVFVLLMALVLLGTTHCVKNWIEYDGIWYFLSNDEYNFTEAISYCADEKAYIAIVTDQLQNEFLQSNNMIGWIGLTNTVFNSNLYNSTITPASAHATFRNNWYWVTEDWTIDRGRDRHVNDTWTPSWLFDNFGPSKPNNTTLPKSVVMSSKGFWEIVDPYEMHRVICEWQCERISIYGESSIASVYSRTHYVNQRWEYVDGIRRLYYIPYRQPFLWTIEVDYGSNNLTTDTFLRDATALSPIYNNTAWENRQNTTSKIRLVCKPVITNVHFEYIQSEETCSGFYTFRNWTESEYLFLYRAHKMPLPLWCISNLSCSENIRVCNTVPSPFPDRLEGQWAPLNQNIWENTTNYDGYDLTTHTRYINGELESNVLHIIVGCAIGGLVIIIIIILIFVIIRRRMLRHKTDKNNLSTQEKKKTEFKDYSYVYARDVRKQNGANNNIEMGKLKHLDNEEDQDNNHLYSLERIPQVNTTIVNDDISKPNKYSTNINETCNTYEDIETVHDQNLTDRDKAKAQGLVNNSPKPVKPPRTFAHESVYSEEESPPPPVPSKGVLDSGKKTVFDNIVFDKDEGHDIELFENTIYETNVTK